MFDWKHYVRSQLPALRVKPSREIEIVEELAAQLEQAYQDALRAGHPDDEALTIAKSQLPDWQTLAVEIEGSLPRPHRASPRFWQGLPGDLRQAFRMLRKSPVFTAVAIATLALGVGGCTTIFSLIEAVILRPIGYPEPDRLVMLWENQYRRGYHKNVVAMADYLDWKARSHVFSDMSPILDQVWNVTGQGDPAVLRGVSVNERFLPMLGIPPLLGRSFSEDETRAGGPDVAILSHRVWIERFGGSREALGRTITLDDKLTTIIGVLPAGFPWLGKPLDVLTPVQFPKRDWRVKAGRFLRVAARLRPGVSLSQAQNEMNGIARQLEAEYPDFNKDWGVEIVPLSEHFTGGTRTALWVLMGAVGLVLLIACSNVANLMLARAVARERELAVRAALGATTQRLISLLMLESFLLALLGGAGGCAAAYAAIRLIQAAGPQDVSRLDSAGINLPVALFTLLTSLITATLFGLAPAVATGRLNLGATLKDGGRGTLNTVRGEKLRGMFVVAQVALALVLLTGASLLIQSLYRLNAVRPGFDSHNVLTANAMFSGKMFSGKMDDSKLGVMCGQMLDRLQNLPGVENASFVTFLPFAGMGAATGFTVNGRPPLPPGQTPVADVRVVLPGYFETMRIPLRRGRLFTAADNRPDAPRTFLVSETLVRQTFGNSDPLGQSLLVQMGDSKPGQIVGVVGDIHHGSLDGEIRPMVYYIQAQLPISFGSFVVRTKGRPEALASAVVGAIQAVKKDQPVTDVLTMDDRIGQSVARLRFQTTVLAGFALIAITLAVIGVYGVMAYSVEQRTHEIGVRLALGADPKLLIRWVTARGIRLAAAGLTLGLVTAAAATRVLHSLLYDVTAHDPGTFAVSALILAIACMGASYVPARRATRVDPLAVLRGE